MRRILTSIGQIASAKGAPSSRDRFVWDIRRCSTSVLNEKAALSESNAAATTDTREIKSDTIAANADAEQSQPVLQNDAKAAMEGNATQGESRAQWVNRPYFDGRQDLPRKAAVLFMYYGGGYFGLQRNPNGSFTIRNNQVHTELRTIEDELLLAMLKSDAISREQFECPQAMQFQRAARTDKGVSALGNVVTTKLRLDRASAESLNEHLPPQIRALDVIRTTRSFDAKLSCTHRTYLYFLPTFTLAPFDRLLRLHDSCDRGQLDFFSGVMRSYVGSHRFHNFTSGKTYEDASARRFIMDVSVSEPFVLGGLELVLVTIKGQSFMLHQIRKMVGLAVAIARGFCDAKLIEITRGPDRYDVPKIPGLGLSLNAVHYDSYNRRYGADGSHKPIVFDPYRERIDAFRNEVLLKRIVETELSERIIWEWMKTLAMHSYQPVILDGQVLPSGAVATRYTKPIFVSTASAKSPVANAQVLTGITGSASS